MRIEVDLKPEDSRAFSRAVTQSARLFSMSGGGLRNVGILFAIGLVFGIALPFVSRSSAESLHWPTVLLTLVIFVVLFAFGILRARRAAADVFPNGRYTYTISGEGIHEQSANTEFKMRWAGVRAIHDRSEHIFILGPGIGVILPKRCLESHGPAVVLATLQEHHRSAGTGGSAR